MIRCVRVIDDQRPLARAHRLRRVSPRANRDATAQSVSGTILGTVTDVERRGRRRRQDHRRQRRHGPDADRHLRCQRRVRRPVDSDRAIHGDGRGGRVQDAGALEHRARRRPAGAHRSQARGRRAHRIGHHRSRQPAPPDLVVRAGYDSQDRAAPGDAAQRPQFREPDAHGPGRAARHSRRRTSTAPAAWRGERRHRSPPTVSARATTTSCSTASTTTRPGCRRSSFSRASTALDEFKLQTSTYSAEFGRSLGGVVNLQIKSGTNMLRGSGFEFHRNDAFDANNFFNNRAGRAKPTFEQNQFGGTLGGAMFRDKTFFFGAYQGHRENLGHTFLSTVPSVAMRSGNFSELDSGHLRSADRAAVPGQHHSRRPDRHRRPQHPARSSIPNRTLAGHAQCEHGTDDRQLPDQSDQAASGQPVRREGRPQPVGEQPVLHTLQLPEDASHPAGDAGRTATPGRPSARATATSRGRAWRSTIRTRSSSRWLNEFRFGWSSIKFLMTPIDYGTNPATAVGLPGINVNDATSAMTQLSVPEHPQPGRQQQPAAHHQPERLPGLRQRDLEHGQAHAEDGRQPDAAVARNPQRRHHRRQFQLQQQHDVELRRPAGRLHGEQQYRLRRRELHARLRQHEEPQPVRREDLHGEAARRSRCTCRTTSA